MKSEIRLSIGSNGAEVVIGEKTTSPTRSDLVRTSAEGKIHDVINSTVVGLGDVAGIILDVFEEFTNEAALRNLKEHGKITISFGMAVGANASLRIVGAKADAFMSVQLELKSDGSNQLNSKVD
ncbi:MAG: hypothetical protein LWX70_10770 [Sphingobacteriia bacterium]|nr:hypothetical protein [Sphingobacteriia bacterium]